MSFGKGSDPNEGRYYAGSLGRIGLAVILSLSFGLNVVLAVRLHSMTVQQFEPAMGKAIVDVSVKDPDGRTVTLDLRSGGLKTVLYVYRPGCGWCAKNLSNVKELAKRLQSTGAARVIGLSLDQEGLNQYLRESDLGFPSYVDIPRDFVDEYRLGATPHTLVVENGRVIKDWRGAYSDDLQREVESTFQVRLPGLKN